MVGHIMKDLKKEKEVLVQALFYMDGVDPNAADLPDLCVISFKPK